jgi:hypothetical protein
MVAAASASWMDSEHATPHSATAAATRNATRCEHAAAGPLQDPERYQLAQAGGHEDHPDRGLLADARAHGFGKAGHAPEYSGRA